MYWLKRMKLTKDVKYDMPIPPMGLDFFSMTAREGKEHFEWFMNRIPERMDYLKARCAKDLDLSVSELDYSAESLILLWRWFLKTARMEKTPKEEIEKMKEGAKIFGESFINRTQFTATTEYIIRDIGMYVGQCFVLNYPQLYWSYEEKRRNRVAVSVTVNQPRISGFRVCYKGKESGINFVPIHMVQVQAANFFDHTQKEIDLYRVYKYWENNIPKQNT